MQEALKKVTSNTAEPVDRIVTLCIRSQRVVLNGIWNWEMQSPAVYCSDVMSFPDDFEGTKGIIHPDDLPKLMASISLMEEKELPRIDFRIITTYGEVKTITGQRVSVDDGNGSVVELLPGREPWEEALEQLAMRRELDFLQIRKELSDLTERLHNIGSWLINKNSGEAWYSDNVFRIYGMAPQSLNTHANSFHSFIHPDDRAAVLDALEKAYSEEVSLHIEYRIVAADGEAKYIQQICKWLFDHKGQIIFSSILRDVTEERSIADELLAAQSSTLLHQQVLKYSELQSASAYWHINLVTRKTSFSDNYYRIFGFKQNQLPSYKSLLNIVHPEDKERVGKEVEKMYSEHILAETQYRIIRPDGKMRYIKQVGKVFISPNNEMIMIGLVQDVTVQKGLEKKIQDLNESTALNKLVTEMTEEIADLSFIIWLPDGYMQWSEGFYRLLGHKPGSVEPLPRSLYRYIHPSDLKKFKDAEALVSNQQNHESLVFRIVSKTGTKQLRISFRQLNYQRNMTIGLVQDISKQNFMHDEFVQTKLYAELVTDAVNDMVIFTNADHTIMQWNEEAEERTGIPKGEALHHNLFEVLPRLNEEEFLGQLHLASRGKELHESKALNRYIRKPHDYWLYPLKNEEGEIMGLLHVVRDVSRQMEMKQQLSERLNFIESLVESSVDRIIALDRFMNYLYWNQNAEKYYGLNKETVLGKNILEVFPSFRNHPSYNEFRKVLRGETVYLPAYYNEEANEYSETYLIPIKDEAGDISAVLWVVHDLSQQWIADKKLKENKDLLQTVFDASPNSISVFEIIYDEKNAPEDFRILMMNLFTQKLINGREVIGQRYSEAFPHVKETRVFDAFITIAATGEAADFEDWYDGEGLHPWFRIIANKIGNLLVVTTEDITVRKTSEEEIKKSRHLLQNIIDAPNIGLAVYKAVRDDNGNIIDFVHEFINRNTLAVLGEDFTGRLLSEHSDNGTSQLPKFIEALQSGKPVNYIKEAEFDGSRHWISFSNSPLDSERVVHTWEDITESKEAELEMLRLKDEIVQKATDRYESLFNSIDEGVTTLEIIFDNNDKAVDFRFLESNPAMTKATGLTPEIHGKTAKEVLPRIQDFWLETYERVVKTGESNRFEYNLEDLNGDWFDVYVSRVGSQESRKVICVYSNITERKKAEEALRKSETQLKTAQEAGNIGIWNFDAATGKVQWSETMWKMYGYDNRTGSPDKDTWENSIHPQDKQRILQGVASFLASGETNYRDEFRVIKVNGDVRWIESVGRLIHDKSGKPVTMAGVNIDITEKVLSRKKIEESEKRFSKLLLESPFAVAILKGKDMIVALANKAIKNVWGKGADIEGKPLLSIMPEIEEQGFASLLDKVYTTGEPFYGHEVLVNLQRNGIWEEVYFNFIYQPYKEGDETISGVTIIANEVTTQAIANKKIAAGEQNVRKLFMQAPAIIVVHRGPQHVYELSNEVHQQTIGHRDLLGKTVREAMPELEGTGIYELLDHVYSTGEPFIGNEVPVKVDKGAGKLEESYFNFVYQPVHNSEGDINGIFVHGVDVTEQVLARKKIEDSEEQLKDFALILEQQVQMRTEELEERKNFIETLATATPDILYVMDLNTKHVTYSNRPVAVVLGYSAEQIKNMQEPFFDLMHEEDIPAMKSHVEAMKTAEDGEVREIEYRLKCEDGEWLWFIDRNTVFKRDTNGNAIEKIGISQNITDRKEAGQKLKTNVTLLQQSEDLAQIGSWEYEIATGKFTWSEGMYKLFGLPQQIKVRPEIYLDHSLEEDRSVAKKIVNSLRKTHDPFEHVMQIKQNNDVRIVKVKGSVIHDEKGKIQKMIGVDIDITNIRQAEEKLKQSRHQVEQTAKASPDAITIYDIQKKQPHYLNNCLGEWTGYSSNELIKMGIEGRLKLVYEDDRLKLLQFNHRISSANDNEVLTLEYRIKKQDGSLLWIRNRSKVFLRDAKGKATHILSFLEDVTEEIKLREELKQRSEYAETILDSSVDRITVFNRDHKFIGWNQRCREVHGISKEEAIGKTISELFPGIENYAVYMDAQKRSLAGEYVHIPIVSDEFTNSYLELFYIPLKKESGETYAVVNIMHDIGALVKNTEEVRVLNKILENKNSELEQKNEEITHFAFVASHDMKEPLRKIQTFSDWLLQQEAEHVSPKGKALIEKMNSAVKRMDILLEDILVLTKIHSDTHKNEEVDLNKVMVQVKEEMSDNLRQTQALIEVKKLPVIKGNRNQVFHLFKNLISNAIKFQKPGNVPHIKIISEKVSGKETGITNAVHEYIKISFTDNGFGFDQGYSKKIFHVFQRLHGKQEFEGTGIGLAICKKIMENHGGSINVKSIQGEGSVFNCYFPMP